jgi:hypothetical protein
MFGFDPTFGYRRKPEAHSLDPSLFQIHGNRPVHLEKFWHQILGEDYFYRAEFLLTKNKILVATIFREFCQVLILLTQVTELVPPLDIPKENHLLISLPDVISVNLSEKL